MDQNTDKNGPGGMGGDSVVEQGFSKLEALGININTKKQTNRTVVINNLFKSYSAAVVVFLVGGLRVLTVAWKHGLTCFCFELGKSSRMTLNS